MVPLASLLRPWLTASSSSDSESSTRLHHSSYLVILLVLSSILSGPTFPIVVFSRNLSKRFSHRGFPSRVPIVRGRVKAPRTSLYFLFLLFYLFTCSLPVTSILFPSVFLFFACYILYLIILLIYSYIFTFLLFFHLFAFFSCSLPFLLSFIPICLAFALISFYFLFLFFYLFICLFYFYFSFLSECMARIQLPPQCPITIPYYFFMAWSITSGTGSYYHLPH
jgi:hypothetical protein